MNGQKHANEQPPNPTPELEFLEFNQKLGVDTSPTFLPGESGINDVPGLIFYDRASDFFAGARIYVYEPNLANPICSMIGAATEKKMSLNCFPNSAPMYVPHPLGLITGLRNPLGAYDFGTAFEVIDQNGV